MSVSSAIPYAAHTLKQERVAGRMAFHSPRSLFFRGETLTASPAADAGSFAVSLPIETLEIHKVFLRISMLDLRQNLSPSALVDSLIASLDDFSPKDFITNREIYPRREFEWNTQNP